MTTTAKPATIDEYIAGFPEDVQQMLEQIRATIKQVVPTAEEAVKYAMPTFVLHGNLIHFAAFKNHIGLYPAPVAIEQFQKELSAYKQSKGAVQLPLNKPLPLKLLAKIVKFRVKQLAEKEGATKKRTVRKQQSN